MGAAGSSEILDSMGEGPELPRSRCGDQGCPARQALSRQLHLSQKEACPVWTSDPLQSLLGPALPVTLAPHLALRQPASSSGSQPLGTPLSLQVPCSNCPLLGRGPWCLPALTLQQGCVWAALGLTGLGRGLVSHPGVGLACIVPAAPRPVS